MSEVKLDSANFDSEVMKAALPVLVDFYADWCGPCKMLAPVLSKLAGAYEGKLIVGKLNVDNGQDIAGKYGITNIPCMIIFKGGNIVDRTVGSRSYPEMEAWVKKFV